jgi:transposase InsO family protein
MPNKAFPPSETRAMAPFELIHSDLKSFPIDLYHKYWYAIVFYDDHTSHAWTINLCTKDAAINATKQFITMVENKFNTNIKRWMSDTGGEYKSNAFIEMLKNKGIEILQSVTIPAHPTTLFSKLYLSQRQGHHAHTLLTPFTTVQTS